MKRVLLLLIFSAVMLGCSKQLDLKPVNDLGYETVFKDKQGYTSVLAKVYAAYTLTGNQGPAGQPDLPLGGDEGWSDFMRALWKAQVLTTDEAIIAWENDPGLFDMHYMNWTSTNAFVQRIYSRPLFQIVLCNEFLKEAADDKLSSRGIPAADAEEIRFMRAEARFLRAYQYWVLLDLFGNPPLITSSDQLGKLPPQTNPKDLFKYIEKELLEIQNLLPAPKQNKYGRADRGACWALLSRLYLNAKTYTGEERYAEAKSFAAQVINSGAYSLADNYRHLFRANNDIPVVSREFILTINYDGLVTKTWGGTTFLVNAQIGGKMKASDFGTNGGWAGLRTTKNFVSLLTDTADRRGMFFSTGQKLEIDTVSVFTNGYAITKWNNLRIDGSKGNNNGNSNHADIDFPLFRLPEMYLNFAEADLRLGGASRGESLGYINQLRRRAYGYQGTKGEITDGDLTLDFLLDERSRELYWECHRRTDLIRYDRFTEGSYVWPWKGKTPDGIGVDPKYKLFPIPAFDISANPNLKQNAGY